MYRKTYKYSYPGILELTIGDSITLDVTDINDLNDKDSLKLNELVLSDIEVL